MMDDTDPPLLFEGEEYLREATDLVLFYAGQGSLDELRFSGLGLSVISTDHVREYTVDNDALERFTIKYFGLDEFEDGTWLIVSEMIAELVSPALPVARADGAIRWRIRQIQVVDHDPGYGGFIIEARTATRRLHDPFFVASRLELDNMSILVKEWGTAIEQTLKDRLAMEAQQHAHVLNVYTNR